MDLGVVVEVNHSTLGSTRCSGLQFNNVVITHISLLTPLWANVNNHSNGINILKLFEQSMTELSTMQYFASSDNYDKGKIPFHFKVIREKVSAVSNRTLSFDCQPFTTNHLHQRRSVYRTYESEDISLCLIYKYENVVTIAEEIADWSSTVKHDQSNKKLFECLTLPALLFLMTGIPSKKSFRKDLYTLLEKLKGTVINPGLRIAVESSPFRNLAFCNSLSRGIISKMMGPNKEGILIDTNLVSGCEGAPIFVYEDGMKGVLIGMVISIMSVSVGECIGFSLGLSMEHLLKAVLEMQSNDYIPFHRLKPPELHSSVNTERLSDAVVFVRCQNKWGSGVVLDAALGIILTCSHIVNQAIDSVFVVHRGNRYQGHVEYFCPHSTPYDLALLSIGGVPGLSQLVMAEKSPRIGESVITAGFPLSTESSVTADGTPTLSAGCISKVSRNGGPLQTTCCTLSGMSGGAVIRLPNQLVGIVVSNIKVNNTVLPFFSFAVSIDDFREIVTQYIETKDPTCLQRLSVKNPEVNMKWTLQDCKL